MTNREKHERRRAAGYKALATRQARLAAGRPDPSRVDLVRRAVGLGLAGERWFWLRVRADLMGFLSQGGGDR